MSIKRRTVWTGYNVHLSETCDEETPHLMTYVETTGATMQEKEMTAPIHHVLQAKDLLPAEHLVDTGSVESLHLVEASTRYDLELLGPITVSPSWQAKTERAFTAVSFPVIGRQNTRSVHKDVSGAHGHANEMLPRQR